MKFRELDLGANRYVRTKPKNVYVITCIKTNRRYVGSAEIVKYRFSGHMKSLADNKHPSSVMQSDFNKYGRDSFCVSWIGFFDVNMARHIEYLMMFYYDTRNPEHGYNHNDKHGVAWKEVFEEETKELLEESKNTGISVECIIRNSGIKTAERIDK